MNSSIKFWDRTAKKYSLRKVKNESELHSRLKRTQKFLKANMEILEVGCGTGSTSIENSKYVKSIIATDFSRNMIEIAKSKMIQKGCKNITFKHESIEEMDYIDHQFDLIIADNVLHLLEDIDIGLQNIFNALKPGGLLVTTTPCVESSFRYFKYVWLIAYKLKIWPYFRAFSPKDFIEKVEHHGFKALEQFYPNKTDVFLVFTKD